MFFAMGANCDCHICLGHGSLNNDVAQIQTRSDKKLFFLGAAVQSSSRTFLVLISFFGGKKKILSGLVCILWETFLVPILLQHACS
jgi:hypothetical protein